MRQLFSLTLSLLLTQLSFGQVRDYWIRFYDTTTQLTGYKDLKGNIKIPLKFDNLTTADTFYNIIAVNEKIGDLYSPYYLLKNGRKVGKDSVFMFDFSYDCESEGKILFKDKKKDRVGFFDRNGVVVIPAIYNAATPFRNGYAIALKNARRKCWGENEDTLNCEHLNWSGGEIVLINEKNVILVDSVKSDLANINWYSCKINDTNIDTSIYISIRGNQGNIYSFIDYEKEFTKWYHEIFLSAINPLNKGMLKNLLFSEILCWTKKRGWTNLNSEKYLQELSGSITKQRFQAAEFKTVSIISQDLNKYQFDKELYRNFYNSCGIHNRDIFPLFDVMLTYYKKRINKFKIPPAGHKLEKWEISAFDKKYEFDYQEHFEFIRTNDGYKFLSESLKN